MPDTRRTVFRVLRIGGLSALGLAVLSALFFPGLLLAFATLAATPIVASVLLARRHGRWVMVWLGAVAAGVWVISLVTYWTVWGEAFDLADAFLPVPLWMELTQRATLVAGVLAFLTVIGVGIFSGITARRLPLMGAVPRLPAI
jgi:hypothetical protein